jgi:hypothetical protein
MADPRQSDFERLNALVDGELGAAERAEIAARLAVDRELASAFATLARLKAVAGETATGLAPIMLPPPRRPVRRVRGASIAAAVALLALGAGLFAWNSDQHETGAEGPTEVQLASLPSGTTIPRLESAGLKLANLAFNPGNVPLFAASYRGPHGCRLDLRAWPVGAVAEPGSGTSVYRWSTDKLEYELSAHGMPDWRFRIIADGAEQQTRLGADPAQSDRRLREANRGAPKCLG